MHGAHMKTTVDIASNILRQSKDLARRDGVTLRSLIEQGLEMVIAERMHARRASVEPVVFGGDGLTPEFQEADWSRIRDAAYGERGV